MLQILSVALEIFEARIASWTASNHSTGCSIARRLWLLGHTMTARVSFDINLTSIVAHEESMAAMTG